MDNCRWTDLIARGNYSRNLPEDILSREIELLILAVETEDAMDRIILGNGSSDEQDAEQTDLFLCDEHRPFDCMAEEVWAIFRTATQTW